MSGQEVESRHLDVGELAGFAPRGGIIALAMAARALTTAGLVVLGVLMRGAAGAAQTRSPPRAASAPRPWALVSAQTGDNLVGAGSGLFGAGYVLSVGMAYFESAANPFGVAPPFALNAIPLVGPLVFCAALGTAWAPCGTIELVVATVSVALQAVGTATLVAAFGLRAPYTDATPGVARAPRRGSLRAWLTPGAPGARYGVSLTLAHP